MLPPLKWKMGLLYKVPNGEGVHEDGLAAWGVGFMLQVEESRLRASGLGLYKALELCPRYRKKRVTMHAQKGTRDRGASTIWSTEGLLTAHMTGQTCLTLLSATTRYAY